jgi:hypothetical protein
MLAEARVEQVAELVAEGRLSQRAIARLTGISRGTVGAISLGTRPRHLRPKSADDDLFRPLGPAVRCGGCGGKVQMPCLLCRVRALLAIERRLAELTGSGTICPEPTEPCLPTRARQTRSDLPLLASDRR